MPSLFSEIVLLAFLHGLASNHSSDSASCYHAWFPYFFHCFFGEYILGFELRALHCYAGAYHLSPIPSPFCFSHF
jgi:hypothetical protein